MKERYSLKKYLHVVPMDNNTCLIYGGENDMLYLKGKSVTLFLTLLQYLNGEYTLDEMIKATNLEAESVRNLISILKEHNLIEDETLPPQFSEGEVKKFEDQLIYFSHSRNGKFYHQLKLKNATVGLLPCPNKLTKCTKNILAKAGVGSLYEFVANEIYDASDKIPQLDIIVVCLDKFSPALLQDVNKFCIQRSLPWMIIQAPFGVEGIVGPIFIPGETSCYNCLEKRLKSNLHFYTEFEVFEEWVKKNKSSVFKFGALEPFWHILAGIASLEIIKYLSRMNIPRIIGRFLTVNFATLDLELHDVLRLPFCPICNKKRIGFSPWLEPIQKSFK